MSMIDCVNRAVRAGLMSPDRAKLARETFNESFDQAKLNLGGDEALAKARTDTIAIIRHQMAQMRREKLLQISRTKDILAKANLATTTTGKAGFFSSAVDFGDSLRAFLTRDVKVKGIESVETRREAVRGILQGRMVDFLERHRRDLLGRVRDKAHLADVLSEINGEATGNASAKEMAQAWNETAEHARMMFNQAGGDIPKLKGWGVPHSHNAIAIRSVGFAKWFEFIEPLLNRSGMIDHSTGKVFTRQGLKFAAEDSYTNIINEGLNNQTPGAVGGQKLARRRMDHRFFVFNNTADWITYNEKFGEGDIFSIMMGHLDGMARDIALLQILGPNPTATTRWMKDISRQKYKADAAAANRADDVFESKANAVERGIDLDYKHLTGSVNAPINGKVGRGFAGLRQTLQAAQLGGAAISAISDVGFAKIAAGRIGIQYRKVLATQLRMLNPLDPTDQKIAIRLGLTAEGWSSIGVAQQRYLGEISGNEITDRLVDGVLRVSGLSPWTQAGRWAFGQEFLGMMADAATKRLDELDPRLIATFERAGISSHDWNMARSSKMYTHKGADFIDPDAIPDEEIALKFLSMIKDETEFAVPSSSIRGRSFLIGDAPPGTFQGELTRSTAMYKNFAVTLMNNHHRLPMTLPTAGERGRYAVQLMLATTLMGGLALQLKDIAKGRDPRNMQDTRFWGAAALQGGGLGIFGDFLFSQKNRYDKGLAQTIAGPVLGAGADALGLINENAAKAMQGKDTKVTAGVIDLAQRYAPGSSLWFARAGIENLIFDELRKMVDPKASQRLRRIERRYKKDYGQEYWMSRANDNIRMPDLTAAFGD